MMKTIVGLLILMAAMLVCTLSRAAENDRFKGGSGDGYSQSSTSAVVVKVANGTVLIVR